MNQSILSKLTDEQKKKVLAAKTPEELLAVAKETGYEMTQSQLDSISSGGWCSYDPGSCDEDYPCFDPGP